MIQLVCLCVLLLPALVLASVRVEPITYSAGEVRLVGSLIYDDAAPPRPPGVLVFPEWWGANDYAQSRGRMLAELGYVAFVADMYGEGKTTTDPKEAAALAQSVRQKPEVMVQRAQAALDAFRQSGKADNQRIAAIGYCMGGSVALHLARSGAEFGAVVSFHGSLANALKTTSPIKPKILICHGAADKTIKQEEILALHKELTDAQVDWLMITYANALHAFTNPAADQHKDLGAIGYNALADQRSWEHMRLFLTEALGPLPSPSLPR